MLVTELGLRTGPKLGAQLRKLRRAQGLTQQQLADRVGTRSKSTISGWEKIGPPVEQIRRLDIALGADGTMLFAAGWQPHPANPRYLPRLIPQAAHEPDFEGGSAAAHDQLKLLGFEDEIDLRVPGYVSITRAVDPGTINGVVERQEPPHRGGIEAEATDTGNADRDGAERRADPARAPADQRPAPVGSPATPVMRYAGAELRDGHALRPHAWPGWIASAAVLATAGVLCVLAIQSVTALRDARAAGVSPIGSGNESLLPGGAQKSDSIATQAVVDPCAAQIEPGELAAGKVAPEMPDVAAAVATAGGQSCFVGYARPFGQGYAQEFRSPGDPVGRFVVGSDAIGWAVLTESAALGLTRLNKELGTQPMPTGSETSCGHTRVVPLALADGIGLLVRYPGDPSWHLVRVAEGTRLCDARAIANPTPSPTG